MTHRVATRVPPATVLALAVYIHGFKVLRDVDVAALFALTVQQLYERIGSRLWSFTPNSFFVLPRAKRDGGRIDARPVLAFTQSGVQLIAAILNDKTSFEIGADVAHALAIKKRSSSSRKRPARRDKDNAKAAAYKDARARLSEASANAVHGNRAANANLKAALRRSKLIVRAKLKIILDG